MIYYWRVGILYYSDAEQKWPEQREGRPSSVFIPGKDIGEAWAALKATGILRDTDVACGIERWSQAEGGVEDERRLKMECRVCHVKPVDKPAPTLVVDAQSVHRPASVGTVPPILPTDLAKRMPNPAGSTMLTGTPMPLTGSVPNGFSTMRWMGT